MAGRCENTAQRKRALGIAYLMLLVCLLLVFDSPAYSNPTEPIVTPSRAYVHDTVLVEGGGVGGGITAIIYLDAVTPWDGSAGAVNATPSEPSGRYSVTFKVPEIPGGTHYVYTVEEGCPVTAHTTFTVVPKLNLLDYLYRDHTYVLEGTGFGESTSVVLMIREESGGARIDYWPAAAAVDEHFGTGDGATRSHVCTLSKTPVKPGTLSVSDGAETFTDGEAASSWVQAEEQGASTTLPAKSA